MDLFLKILMIVVFFVITIYVGFYCRKKATTSNDFILGGRKLGPWLSAFAYGTSYFSAVIFIGYAGSFGWQFGLSALWIGIGNALIGSLLAWVVLGRRTRQVTQKMKSATMPDFFGKRYESKRIKKVASIIVFIFLIPYTAALYNGLSSLFSSAFGFDRYEVWIIIIAAITGVYVIIGGLMSTAVNSFIQGLIMLVGIIAVVIAVLNTNGGLTSSTEALATKGWQYASIFGDKPIDLIFVILLTSMGAWALPQMVGKFYSINDGKQIQKGAIISTVFALIVAGGCYFLGGFGRLFVESPTAVGGYDGIVPSMISGLPVLIVGIVIVLVLAASMSTLASLVLTSASTIMNDIIKEARPGISEKKQMWWLRGLVVVFIVISAGIAIFQIYGPESMAQDIASLMGVSWGAISGAFLAPFLLGLYWKRTTKAGVWASFGTGVGIMVLYLIFVYTKANVPAFFTNSIKMGVVSMAMGFVVVPVVSLFTKPPRKELVEDLFSAYEIEKEFSEVVSVAYEEQKNDN